VTARERAGFGAVLAALEGAPAAVPPSTPLGTTVSDTDFRQLAFVTM
jgi:hypothetical protein